MKQTEGSFAIIIMILHVVALVGSGVLAWNWVSPESFLGAIGFLIVWGILETIGYFLVLGVIYLFGEMD